MAGQQQGGFRGFVDRSYTFVVTKVFPSYTVTTSTEPAEVPECKLPGCSQRCFVENNGHIHDFCGKSHAMEYHSNWEESAKKKQKLVTGLGTPADVCTPGIGGTCSTCSNRFTEANYGSNVIRFYNRGEPYYQFTNFYPAPIILDDKEWPTTEHYFQAQKFIGTPFTEVIRHCQHPREAFNLSRNRAVSRWRRKDWEDVKINVMRKALLAKFTQHEYLREMLLRTGHRHLIEHSPHDKFWGNGGDDSGLNKLGLLLTEIRSDLLKIMEMEFANATGASPSLHPRMNLRENAREGASDIPRRSSNSSSSRLMANIISNPETSKEGENQHNGQSQIDSFDLHHPLVQCYHPQPGSPVEATESQPPDIANLIDLSDDNGAASYGAIDKPENSDVDKLMMAFNLPDTLDKPLLTTSTAVGFESATTADSTKSTALENATIPVVEASTETAAKTTTESSKILTSNHEVARSDAEIGRNTTVTNMNTPEAATVDTADITATEFAADTVKKDTTDIAIENVKDQPVAVNTVPGEMPAAQQSPTVDSSYQGKPTDTIATIELLVEGGQAPLQQFIPANGSHVSAVDPNILSNVDVEEDMDTTHDNPAEPQSVVHPDVNSEENVMDASSSNTLRVDDEDEGMDET